MNGKNNNNICKKHEIIIPENPRIIKSKTIVAVYRRLKEDVYIALALVTPSPFTPRWEPHILLDNGFLEDFGYARIAGFLSLAKYNCVRDLFIRKLKNKIIGTLHLAPWGIPVLIVERADIPLSEERASLDENGGNIALKVLEDIVNDIEIKFK